jgi:outer membrane protein insertion porin family
MEGTWFSTQLVKEGKERILRRGYATQVNVETPRVPGIADQVDVIYGIEEARMGQFSAGVAFSQSEHLMFNLGLTQENFLGTGKTIQFNFDNSRSASSYSLDYMDPYFTIDGVGMGAGGYYTKTDPARASNISFYSADTVGAQLRWVFPMSRYEALNLSLGYDDTQLKINSLKVASQVLDFVGKHGKKYTEYSVGLGWSYDALDQRIFPKRGLAQNIHGTVITPGSKLKYYKTTYNVAYYKPVAQNERWIVNLSSALGYGKGYGSTKQYPFFKNFTLGGGHTLRGFEEGSVGPRDSQGRTLGGNVMVSGTAALIFPNPIKPDIQSIRTAAFIDMGQIYATQSHTKKESLRYSVGLSLTWNSPLGAPLVFSLAKPIRTKPGDEVQKFAFSIGSQL